MGIVRKKIMILLQAYTFLYTDTHTQTQQLKLTFPERRHSVCSMAVAGTCWRLWAAQH